MRKPDEQKCSERLVVPMPSRLAEAVERASALRMQDKAEYGRQAILNQLAHDGVEVERAA